MGQKVATFCVFTGGEYYLEKVFLRLRERSAYRGNWQYDPYNVIFALQSQLQECQEDASIL